MFAGETGTKEFVICSVTLSEARSHPASRESSEGCTLRGGVGEEI